MSNNTTTAHTRIALVLDRSGSMEIIRAGARDAFNEAISRVQSDAVSGQAAGMQTALSVVTFNDRLQDVLIDASPDRIKPLGPDDYRPDGMTALFDAVGHSIDVLEKAGPLGKEDAALVIVISDGHENSSRHVTQADLVERMQKLEATEQWTFSFLMANVDINDLSRRFQTEKSNYAAWTSDKAGVSQAGKDLSYSVSRYMRDRRSGLRSKKEFFLRQQEEERRRVEGKDQDSGD